MGESKECAVLIRQIHGELEKNANNVLRKDDITMSQMDVLMRLCSMPDGKMGLKELEKSLHVAQPTAAGIVKRLERKGYIESFVHPTDRRIKVIRITTQGQECYWRARGNMVVAENGLTSALTDIEESILLKVLQKVRDSL